MIKYSIIILPLAEDDITEATDYIAFEKQSPEIAISLAKGLRKTISTLELQPERHELDDDKELAELGIRRHYYKNYKIFYMVDNENATVYILRVLHMLVDARSRLLMMFKV
jgi:plasmid stabilization system protein ParE